MHTGADAARAADVLDARAFTVGADVYFGAGEFVPGRLESDRLLAHELTHVRQQHDSGTVLLQRQSRTDAGIADTEAEAEARRNADAVVDTRRDAGPVDRGGTSGGTGTSGPRSTSDPAKDVIAALNRPDPIAGSGDIPSAFKILDALSTPDLVATLSRLDDGGYLDLLIGTVGRAQGSYARAMTCALAVRQARATRPLTPNEQSEVPAATFDTTSAGNRERNQLVGELGRLPQGDPRRLEIEARIAVLEGAARTGQRSSGATDDSTHLGGFGGSTLITSSDSAIRIRSYVDAAEKMSQTVLDDLAAGRITHQQARELAVKLRNEALSTTREQVSPGARELSKALKEEGKSLAELTTKYAQAIVQENPARFGLFGFEATNPTRVRDAAKAIEGTEEVSFRVIQAAGRTNTAMTVMARVGRVAGPVGVGVSLAFSGYEIYQAAPADRAKVATREAGGFAGGMLGAAGGGLVAAWTASLVCGPGAVVCGIVLSLVVVGGTAYAGGRGGEWLAVEAFNGINEPPTGPPTLWLGGVAPVPGISPFLVGGGLGGLMERDRRRAYGVEPP